MGGSSLYRALTEIPIPVSAEYLSAKVLRVTFTAQDHLANVKRTTQKTVFLGADSDTPQTSPHAEIGDVVASRVSPRGRYVAKLREAADEGGCGKKRYVEIWAGDRLEGRRDVTDLHGSFYTDNFLGSLSFNTSEDVLIYTAEENPPKDTGDHSFARFRFTPNFGEALTSKQRPVLFGVCWAGHHHNIRIVQLTEDYSSSPEIYIGQAIFAGESHIFATGYEPSTDGRLLGLKGCMNRPANIWDAPFEFSTPPPSSQVLMPGGGGVLPTKSWVQQVQQDRSARSSRSYQPPLTTSESESSAVQQESTPSSEPVVIWLSNLQGSAHDSCASLHSYDMKSKEISTVVDTVDEPGDKNGFPGLYVDSLAPDPFLFLGEEKGVHVVTHSVWGSRTTVLLISLQDKTVTDLTPGGEYSWTVLCTNVDNNHIVCARSSLSCPPEVVLGVLGADGKVEKWTVLIEPSITERVKDKLSSLRTSVITIPERYPTETIVLRPNSSEILPLLTMPHGGPHSTTTTAFNAQSAALALQGYTLSMINYTGSLGFGQKYVKKLLGQCGKLDVDDCIATVKFLIDQGIAQDDSDKLFVIGGSHGGFLAAHLIGQYPDKFNAAVIRNPVVALQDVSGSDIPDWYFEENDVSYRAKSSSEVPALLNPDLFKSFYDRSPMALVPKVHARVLLLIGEADQRVSPNQGKGYYHALKARKCTVDMLCFPKDSHPLDGVEAARVGWEATLDWIKPTDSE